MSFTVSSRSKDHQHIGQVTFMGDVVCESDPNDDPCLAMHEAQVKFVNALKKLTEAGG